MPCLLHVIMYMRISYTCMYLCVKCVDTVCNLVHVFCMCVMLQFLRKKVQDCGKEKFPVAGVL